MYLMEILTTVGIWVKGNNIINLYDLNIFIEIVRNSINIYYIDIYISINCIADIIYSI